MKINLTNAEIWVILSYIENNRDEGYYYGNKEQYFKRLDKLEKKLGVDDD
jgi:hypothetical protein